MAFRAMVPDRPRQDFTRTLQERSTGSTDAGSAVTESCCGVSRWGAALPLRWLSGSALDVASLPQPAGFADTFGGRLGFEARPHERLAIRAGASIRPTPVPRQDTPGTNLMDNTTVGAALGASVNFPDPTGVLSRPIFIELTGQSQFILKREANKERTDDTPSYTYSGTMLGLVASLRYDF